MEETKYAFEKLSMAVRILATNPDSLQRRLEHAYYAFQTVHEDKLDQVDQKRMFREIRETITAVDGKDGHGGVQATLNEMSDDAARELAEKIFSLFTSILR